MLQEQEPNVPTVDDGKRRKHRETWSRREVEDEDIKEDVHKKRGHNYITVRSLGVLLANVEHSRWREADCVQTGRPASRKTIMRWMG